MKTKFWQNCWPTPLVWRRRGLWRSRRSPGSLLLLLSQIWVEPALYWGLWEVWQDTRDIYALCSGLFCIQRAPQNHLSFSQEWINQNSHREMKLISQFRPSLLNSSKEKMTQTHTSIIFLMIAENSFSLEVFILHRRELWAWCVMNTIDIITRLWLQDKLSTITEIILAQRARGHS